MDNKELWSDWVDWYQCQCGARGAYRKEYMEEIVYYCVKCGRTNLQEEQHGRKAEERQSD